MPEDPVDHPDRPSLEDLEARLARVEVMLGLRKAAAPRASAAGEPERPALAKVTNPPFRPWPATSPAPAPTPTRPSRRLDLESLIGGRAFAVAGALAVLVGLGFFFKIALDAGWFGGMPAWARCAGGAVFGLTLLGLGEWARRRINAWSSVGLSAAGLAALYLSAFAAHAWYGLMGSGPAFVLLAGVSALGVVVAARADLVAVAIVSLLGAYLTPVLLRTADPNPLVLPTYLVAVLGGAMALSAWKRGGFRTAGSLGWWATLVMGSLSVFTNGADHPVIALVFMSATWVLCHVAAFAGTRPGEASVAPELLTLKQTVTRAGWPVRHVAASLSVSAWACGLGAWVLHESGLASPYLAPTLGAGVTLALAVSAFSLDRLLRERPTTPRALLGAVLLASAAGLAMAGLALGVSGDYAVLAWLAMGLAAVVAGRWTGALPLAVYGVVLLAGGTGRLVMVDSWGHGDTGQAFLGLWWSVFTTLALMSGAAWLIAGVIMQREGDRARTGLARFSAATAVAVAMIAVLSPMAWIGTIALAWTLVGLVAVGLDQRLQRLMLHAWGCGALTLGALLWVAAHATGRPEVAAAPAWVRQTETTGVFIGLALLAAAVLARGRLTVPAPVIAAGSAAMMFCAFACSDQPLGVQMVAWCVIAVILGGLGEVLRGPRLAWSAAGVLIAAAGAWLIGYVVRTEMTWVEAQYALVAHPGLWTAVMLAGVVALLARRCRAGPDWDIPGRELWLASIVAGGLVMFCATSLQIGWIAQTVSQDRTAQMAAVSLWWAVLGTAAIVVGFLILRPVVRHTGLMLVSVAAAKLALFDLGDIPPAWRVAGFVGIGLLMIGVAVVYGLVARVLSDRALDRNAGDTVPDDVSRGA